MKKILSSFLGVKLEDKFGSIKDKFLNAVNAHPEIFSLSLLGVFCLIFLFIGLNAYPLIDVDETRYAIIARTMVLTHNWNDLMLNGVPFLEKPPLYFWLVAASVKLFGQFTPLIVRLPIALISSFLVFFTYYVGKKAISRKFGLISSLVLLTSALFLILSHIAIIDMVLTVFMTGALYFAFLANLCTEKYKKFAWWYFYLFMGLGFLAKGLLALVIPVLIVSIYSLATKTFKEIFKPINIIPGIIIFLIAVLPWHLIMYQHYGFEFIRQYFLLHHFGRFMGSEYIGRERPLLYFVPVFLLGFLPWSFVFIAFLWNGFKTLEHKAQSLQGSLKEKFSSLIEAETTEKKLLLFSVISFVVIFVLFSVSTTKLPTYILPAFPFAALLTGYYWWYSDEKQQNEKAIYNLTIVFSAVLIIAALVATFSWPFLPDQILAQVNSFCDQTIKALYLLGIFLVLRVSTKRVLSVFSGYLLTMLFVVILAAFQIFNVVYNGGENEIEAFSEISSSEATSQLVTFDFAVKPSVLINSHSVVFITDPDFKALDKCLRYTYGDTFVIIKNKNLEGNADYQKEIDKRLMLVRIGRRYSLYVKKKAINGKHSHNEQELFLGQQEN